MIAGIYHPRGGPAQELDAFDRLRRIGEPAVHGPLAVLATGPQAETAEVDGIVCVLDGFLHDAARLATALGVTGDHDAGLIAGAYRRHGADALARLRGRFSLVLWDRSAGRGLLATDPLATRQLFSCAAAGGLVFAGEVRDLLGLLATRPAPDPVAFPSFLMSGACPEGLTLYAGVTRTGPGELLALEDEPTRRTYWRPQFAGTLPSDREQLVEGLRTHILDSTRRRLAPDTGVILSGGLDSSLVTAAAHATQPPGGRLRTYSAVFPGAPYDESDKIRELTERLSIERRTFEIAPQGTLWQALRYLAQWQLPLGGMGALVDLAATADAGADGVAVLMDGQTGDEVLGFAPYLVADRLRHGRLLGALGLIGRWPGRPPTKPHQRMWLLREIGIKGAAPYGLGQTVRARRETEADAAPLLPHLHVRRAELEDRWAWKARHPGPLWWRQLADVLVYGPHREQRLDYLRHRAAAVDTVGESPLYDVDLIEYCLSLPPELAFDPRYDRALAREAAVGLLPEPVRLQPRKADFGPFAHAAVTGADAPGLERLLTAPDAELRAYLDPDWLARSWRALRTSGFGEAPGLSQLWRLASAECWLRLQADPGFAEAMLADPQIPGVATTDVALSR